MFLKELWLKIMSAVTSHKAKHDFQWELQKTLSEQVLILKSLLGNLFLILPWVEDCINRILLTGNMLSPKVIKQRNSKHIPLCVWHSCPYSNGWSVFAPVYLLTMSSKEQMQNLNQPCHLGTCSKVTECLAWLEFLPAPLVCKASKCQRGCLNVKYTAQLHIWLQSCCGTAHSQATWFFPLPNIRLLECTWNFTLNAVLT